jgi:hypothetical protein
VVGCFFDAEHDLHALIFEVEAGDVGAQGHIHTLLHEETVLLQLLHLLQRTMQDVIILYVCLQLSLFFGCFPRVLDARVEDDESVSALTVEEHALDEVSVLCIDLLAH